MRHVNSLVIVGRFRSAAKAAALAFSLMLLGGSGANAEETKGELPPIPREKLEILQRLAADIPQLPAPGKAEDAPVQKLTLDEWFPLLRNFTISKALRNVLNNSFTNNRTTYQPYDFTINWNQRSWIADLIVNLDQREQRLLGGIGVSLHTQAQTLDAARRRYTEGSTLNLDSVSRIFGTNFNPVGDTVRYALSTQNSSSNGYQTGGQLDVLNSPLIRSADRILPGGGNIKFRSLSAGQPFFASFGRLGTEPPPAPAGNGGAPAPTTPLRPIWKLERAYQELERAQHEALMTDSDLRTWRIQDNFNKLTFLFNNGWIMFAQVYLSDLEQTLLENVCPSYPSFQTLKAEVGSWTAPAATTEENVARHTKRLELFRLGAAVQSELALAFQNYPDYRDARDVALQFIREYTDLVLNLPGNAQTLAQHRMDFETYTGAVMSRTELVQKRDALMSAFPLFREYLSLQQSVNTAAAGTREFADVPTLEQLSQSTRTSTAMATEHKLKYDAFIARLKSYYQGNSTAAEFAASSERFIQNQRDLLRNNTAFQEWRTVADAALDTVLEQKRYVYEVMNYKIFTLQIPDYDPDYDFDVYQYYPQYYELYQGAYNAYVFCVQYAEFLENYREVTDAFQGGSSFVAIQEEFAQAFAQIFEEVEPELIAAQAELNQGIASAAPMTQLREAELTAAQARQAIVIPTPALAPALTLQMLLKRKEAPDYARKAAKQADDMTLGEAMNLMADIVDALDNLPPDALGDSAQTRSTQTIDIDPTSNDIDPDLDDLRLIDVSQPDKGMATIVGGDIPLIRYEPPPDYTGEVVLTYTVSDDKVEGTATGQIVIQVMPDETATPTPSPTETPTMTPTTSPTETPTSSPTPIPTMSPTSSVPPTNSPTASPTPVDTVSPTATMTTAPTASPTFQPTMTPTATPVTGDPEELLRLLLGFTSDPAGTDLNQDGAVDIADLLKALQ